MPPEKNLARLACLIHAASVRSEPESNSPFKLGGRGDQRPTRPKFVAGAAKAPTDLTLSTQTNISHNPEFLQGRTSTNPGFVRSKSLISKKIAAFESSLGFVVSLQASAPIATASA